MVIAAVVLRDPPRRVPSDARPPRRFAGMARALRSRAYRAAASANLADGFAALGVRGAIVPLFVRDVLHRSAVWTGIGFLTVAALNAAVLLPAGWAADRLGRRPVIVVGCSVSAAGLVALSVLPGLWGYMTALAILGLGSGLLDVAPAAMIGDILGGQGGTVIASYQMAGDFGAVAGPVTGRLPRGRCLLRGGVRSGRRGPRGGRRTRPPGPGNPGRAALRSGLKRSAPRPAER